MFYLLPCAYGIGKRCRNGFWFLAISVQSLPLITIVVLNLFLGNMDIYLHFLPLWFFSWKAGTCVCFILIPRLLMPRWRKEPGHQQPWYHPWSVRISRFHLVLTWINFNPSNDKVWDEITYQFPNFNGAAVEVSEWISNSIPHFTGHLLIHSGIKVRKADWEVFNIMSLLHARVHSPYRPVAIVHITYSGRLSWAHSRGIIFYK